jgi:hypothetical protein
MAAVGTGVMVLLCLSVCNSEQRSRKKMLVEYFCSMYNNNCQSLGS